MARFARQKRRLGSTTIEYRGALTPTELSLQCARGGESGGSRGKEKGEAALAAPPLLVEAVLEEEPGRDLHLSRVLRRRRDQPEARVANRRIVIAQSTDVKQVLSLDPELQVDFAFSGDGEVLHERCVVAVRVWFPHPGINIRDRSEEHTSELQ